MSTANNGYVQSKTDIYFQKLFTNSSVAIWDADFTALMADISQLKSDGITDLHRYFKENKCALKVLAESIKTNQANRAALELFKVHSEQEIRPLISDSFLSSASLPFINLLSALRNDDEIFETEFEIFNNLGGKLNLLISISLEVTEKNAKSILIQFIDISKFQNSYKALKEGETPFQKLADLSEEAIIVNIKGEFIDHNQAAERVFGYSQEEFSKLNAKDLISPEDYPLALQSLENDSEAPYEINAIKKNGDRFPILVKARMIKIDAQDVRVTSMQDLSALKKIKAEKEKTNLTLNNFFNLSSDLMCVGKLGGYFTELNPSWESTLGWTKEEFLSRTCRSFIHSDDAIKFPNQFSHSTSSGVYQSRFICKDGSYKWLEWSEIIAEDGTFNATARDITERKLIEEKLKNDEQTLHQKFDFIEKIINESPAGIAIYNPEGLCVSANISMANMLGAKQEQLLAQNYHELETWKASGLYEAALDTMSSDVPVRHDVVVESSFGKMIALDCSLVRFKTEGEYHLLIMVLDINDRLEAENNLLHAKEDAEKANRSKSEFLSSMSHDLRTPLNAIMGFSDLIRSKTFGPINHDIYSEYVEIIHNSGNLLVSLINDILDISKVEAGKYSLTETEIDLSKVIQSCLQQNSIQASQSELSIMTDIPEHLPLLQADERVLTQILNNLCSNAIKYSPPKTSIMFSASLNETGGMTLKVTDTGYGMTKVELETVIKPFEQANSSITSKIQGTGLGLYLCKNFMALFEGSLDLESEVGKGTTVTINFPSSRVLGA